MEFVLKNDRLIAKISSHGAELVSLQQADTGRQMIWQADPAVWGRHAPLLFPYTGRLRGGKFTWQGKEYTGGQHGFGRDMEFSLFSQDDTTLDLVLRHSEKTLEIFPFAFTLHSIFALQGNTLTHTLKVENPGTEVLRFGIGYHPAFLCPFDGQHVTGDYQLEFDTPQTPVVVETLITGENGGLVSGKQYELMQNSAVIPLHDRLFDQDSICMSRLTAKTLSIVEKGTGRRVTLNIEGFPYVLIWSAITPTLQYVCVEPWHSLPDTVEADGEWEHKPCAAAVQPGESWQTSLPMTFEW